MNASSINSFENHCYKAGTNYNNLKWANFSSPTPTTIASKFVRYSINGEVKTSLFEALHPSALDPPAIIKGTYWNVIRNAQQYGVEAKHCKKIFLKTGWVTLDGKEDYTSINYTPKQTTSNFQPIPSDAGLSTLSTTNIQPEPQASLPVPVTIAIDSGSESQPEQLKPFPPLLQTAESQSQPQSHTTTVISNVTRIYYKLRKCSFYFNIFMLFICCL
jgi:hypothetical protein